LTTTSSTTSPAHRRSSASSSTWALTSRTRSRPGARRARRVSGQRPPQVPGLCQEDLRPHPRRPTLEFWEHRSFSSPETATKIALLRLFSGAWNAILPRESWAQVFQPRPRRLPRPGGEHAHAQPRGGAGARCCGTALRHPGCR
jgi:hypothetical protein